MSTPPSAPPPPEADTRRPGGRWKTWQLAAAALVALIIGVGIGSAGGGEVDDSEPQEQAGAEVEDLEAEIDRLEDELEARDEALAAAVEQAEAEPEPEATEEPEPEPEPEAEAAEEDGTYTVGDYTFADVQVGEDFAGDFEIRTRMTNNGDAKDSVGIKATLFSGGSVVGTADGIVNDVDGGATVTMEMFSTDEHVEWDEIEFQVEYEF